jgi:uncharacterized protein (DUF1501 family)
MNNVNRAARRRLLQLLGTGFAAGALWPRLAAAEAAATDYRALVCVVQDGGNDGENTLIRHDTAGYQRYAAARPPSSGINIAQSALLPVQPASQDVPFGFHPACGPLQGLFAQKKLAVVANVGNLVRPVTRTELLANAGPRPSQLFNHSDQVRQIMTADATDLLQTGWGGRIADRLAPLNAGNLFPPLTTLGDTRAFINGISSIPLALPVSDFFAILEAGTPQLTGLRDAALLQMLREARTNRYEQAAQVLANKGLQSADVVNPIFQSRNTPVSVLFNGQNSWLAKQLRQVARLIEARATTGLKRQVFFVRQPGYDTHVNQLAEQGLLLGDLGSGLKTFTDAMALLNLERNVTTFTLSDFGRTLKPAAGGGTDHGYGNYAFVLGGAVRGGDIYGTVPTATLGGPDDIGDDGRWIPTTSIEQYGATLASWLGLDQASLDYVFPNLPAFGPANLGFMTA